jgi:hypothetical protein
MAGVSAALNPNDAEWGGSEAWRYSHYFDAGGRRARLVIVALIAAGREMPRRILTPSGSGRVAKHSVRF